MADHRGGCHSSLAQHGGEAHLHRKCQGLHPVCAAEFAGAQCFAGAESQLLAEHRIDCVDDSGERGLAFEKLLSHPRPV